MPDGSQEDAANGSAIVKSPVEEISSQLINTAMQCCGLISHDPLTSMVEEAAWLGLTHRPQQRPFLTVPMTYILIQTKQQKFPLLFHFLC